MHFVAAALGDVNAKEPVRAESYPCSKLTRLLETTMSPNCYHSCVTKAIVLLAASQSPITFWLFDLDPVAHLEHYINYRQEYKSCSYGSETGKARTIVHKAQEICPRTMSGINANLGLKLLRLAPLIISSGSLMCGIDQTTALKPFTRPELAKKYSGLILPRCPRVL